MVYACHNMSIIWVPKNQHNRRLRMKNQRDQCIDPTTCFVFLSGNEDDQTSPISDYTSKEDEDKLIADVPKTEALNLLLIALSSHISRGLNRDRPRTISKGNSNRK